MVDVQHFQNQGWGVLASPSIVRDVADLLHQLHASGRRLGLLSESPGGDRVIDSLHRAARTGDGEALSMLSDQIAMLIHARGVQRRAEVGILYDLAKHLRSFHALLANNDIAEAVGRLLGSTNVMVHKDSVGMRIDLPGEAAQLTALHQEFHSFPFGTNGLVLWIPLTRIDGFNGTICFHPQPHASAPYAFEGNPKDCARLHALGRHQEAQKTGRLVIPEGTLGDPVYLEAPIGNCYFMSAMLPHESVPANRRATTARLTCQARLFDVDDPFLAWKAAQGSLMAGLKSPFDAWELWKRHVTA